MGRQVLRHQFAHKLETNQAFCAAREMCRNWLRKNPLVSSKGEGQPRYPTSPAYSDKKTFGTVSPRISMRRKIGIQTKEESSPLPSLNRAHWKISGFFVWWFLRGWRCEHLVWAFGRCRTSWQICRIALSSFSKTRGAAFLCWDSMLKECLVAVEGDWMLDAWMRSFQFERWPAMVLVGWMALVVCFQAVESWVLDVGMRSFQFGRWPAMVLVGWVALVVCCWWFRPLNTMNLRSPQTYEVGG